MSDVEVALLGCCLVNRHALGIAQEEGVTPAHFSGEAHRLIFAAIERAQLVVPTDGLTDAVVVVQQLNGHLEAAGGRAYIHSLASAVPLATNARQYARAVVEASVGRAVRRILQEGLESPAAGWEALANVQDALFRLEHPDNTGTTLQAALEWVYEQADKPLAPSCSYPWNTVDFLTRGLRPGWLSIMAGETSFGKTAAALQVSVHNLRAKKRVLYLTREMLPRELGVRVAQTMGASADRIYGGAVNEHDCKAILAAMKAWAAENMRIEMMDRPERIAALVRRHRPDLVVVDYLQLLDLPKGVGRVEGTAQNSHLLKAIAHRYEVPVLCLSQFSRVHREDREKMPGLWNLKDSSAIEQDADQVVLIHRKRSKESHTPEREGSLVVAKARNGRTGMVKTVFDPDAQQFLEAL